MGVCDISDSVYKVLGSENATDRVEWVSGKEAGGFSEKEECVSSTFDC